MFLSYYGLEKNLFQKEIKVKEGFKSENYNVVMSRLEYLKEVKGIGLFIGSTGIGKTYCIRSFNEKLNKDLYKLTLFTRLLGVKYFSFYKNMIY